MACAGCAKRKALREQARQEKAARLQAQQEKLQQQNLRASGSRDK